MDLMVATVLDQQVPTDWRSVEFEKACEALFQQVKPPAACDHERDLVSAGIAAIHAYASEFPTKSTASSSHATGPELAGRPRRAETRAPPSKHTRTLFATNVRFRQPARLPK